MAIVDLSASDRTRSPGSYTSSSNKPEYSRRMAKLSSLDPEW